jgi:ABC-type bacteriocin/lantibiotic exporter with double-glycine peptidase domain
MNTAVANATNQSGSALQSLMDNVVVSYGLKILGAIAVIIALLLISKIIANIVRRNIIKNASQGNKHIDKV